MINSTRTVQSQQFTRARFFTFAKLLLAAALVIAVARQLKPDDLMYTLSKASPCWFAMGVITFFGSVMAMALRAWKLLDQRVTYRDILGITALQTAVGNLIATSAGLATYLATLRTKHETSLRTGTFTIIMTRLSDLAVFGSGLLVSSVILWEHLISVRTPLFIIAFLVAFAMACILATFTLRSRLLTICIKIMELLRIDDFEFTKRVISSIRSISLMDSSILLTYISRTIVYTIIPTLFSYLFLLSCLYTFDLYINPWQLLFILSFTQIIAIIPIQILGGLGIFDLTTLYLLTIFGYDSGKTTAALVGLRIIFYLANLCILIYPTLQSLLQMIAQRITRGH
jgi:hypothetical protein